MNILKLFISMLMILTMLSTAYAACPSNMLNYWSFDESNIGDELDSAEAALWENLRAFYKFNGNHLDSKGTRHGSATGASFGEGMFSQP